MKFRTEITPHPLRESIAYSSRIFAMGSCFAENISERLQRAKFRVVSNPTGIMFNPASIAASLERFAEGRPYAAEEFTHADGRWFSFDAHTSLSGKTAEEALAKMNCAVQAGHEALERADWVILTFGTSWIYELNATGRVVANCHKRPQSHFTRRRLSADEIVGMYDSLMTGLLREKNVIFTVSPVRHVGDGLEGNSVSKAVLRVAVDEIVGRHDNAFYFPSYEIVNDDLRDYRFYDRDLVHPNSQAIDYIWEIFSATALSDGARELLPRVERIVAAAAHRPFNPDSEEYTAFCRKMSEATGAMKEIDFSEELNFFGRFCK